MALIKFKLDDTQARQVLDCLRASVSLSQIQDGEEGNLPAFRQSTFIDRFENGVLADGEWRHFPLDGKFDGEIHTLGYNFWISVTHEVCAIEHKQYVRLDIATGKANAKRFFVSCSIAL